MILPGPPRPFALIVPDAQIVRDVLNGRTEAFEELVERHHRRVFALALRMVGNRSDAEDISQEVFVKLYENLHKYDPAQPLQNWLLRIASNHTLNWLEKHRKGKEVQEKEELGESRPTLRLADAAPLPDARVEQRELGEALSAALGRLPDNYRLVVVLKYIEEYTSEEIAEILGAPRNTVKTWILRARDALRTELSTSGGMSL